MAKILLSDVLDDDDEKLLDAMHAKRVRKRALLNKGKLLPSELDEVFLSGDDDD